MNVKLYILLIIPFLFCSANPCAQTETRISRSRAVQMAEEFIVQNGYTELPPMEDKSKLAYESCCSDVGSPVEEILKRRYNTVEHKAYGVRLMSPFKNNRNKRFWYLIFRYKEPCGLCNPGAGRVVRMSEDGSSIEVVHQDFALKDFKNERIR